MNNPMTVTRKDAKKRSYTQVVNIKRLECKVQDFSDNLIIRMRS